MLQGAHEETEDRLLLDLNEIYRQELDFYLANPFFKHRLEKHFHFHAGLPPIYGHYIDFSQSFRNLLENALEAMEGCERRRLTVATGLEKGRRLLHLGDTGPGIPPEIRPRLFEPFFTTKADRAGLGLFMARRLLSPYGGEIMINSVPGETWVTVVLPLKGQPLGGGWNPHLMLTAFIVNGAWGIGTGLFLRVIAGWVSRRRHSMT
jgi:signal transduction histidine kinase